MTRTIITAGLLAMSTVVAVAADLPVKARPVTPAMATTAYNWTGIYSATTVGIQRWDIEGTYLMFPMSDHRTEGTRWTFGTHLGYQHQFGNWVLGIEGGFNSGYNPTFTSSNSISPECLGGTGPAGRTCESRIANYWNIGGKVGFAWDSFMVYAQGGYANGRIDTQTTVTGTPSLTSATTARHGGWYVGGGFDVYVTKLWWSDLIVGVEYQHVEFASLTHIDTLGVAVAGTNDRNMRATDDVVRLKITSKWNWAAPAVVAKY